MLELGQIGNPDASATLYSNYTTGTWSLVRFMGTNACIIASGTTIKILMQRDWKPEGKDT